MEGSSSLHESGNKISTGYTQNNPFFALPPFILGEELPLAVLFTESDLSL